MKRTIVFLLIAVLTIALAGCGGKGGPPATVATVDGKPVSGELYYEFLDTSFGRQALPSLIDYQVMLNWAAKEKVPVTDAQIDKQMDILKRDGNYDDQVVNLGGEQALRNRYKQFQAAINLGEKFNKFTESELKEMYNEPFMKTRYVRGPRQRVILIISTSKAEIDKAKKALEKGMDFEAAAVKYSDAQFTMGGPVKTFVSKGEGPEGLYDAAKKLKDGQVSKPFQFTLSSMGEYFGIVKVIGEQPKLDLKFDQVKDEVKAMAALQKTSTPEFQKKFEAQKKKADIVILLPQYKYMVDQIKNPPPPMMGMPGGQ